MRNEKEERGKSRVARTIFWGHSRVEKEEEKRKKKEERRKKK